MEDATRLVGGVSRISLELLRNAESRDENKNGDFGCSMGSPWASFFVSEKVFRRRSERERERVAAALPQEIPQRFLLHCLANSSN